MLCVCVCVRACVCVWVWTIHHTVSEGMMHVRFGVPVLQWCECQVVTWGECVRTHPVVRHNLPTRLGLHSLKGTGLKRFHTAPRLFQLVLILGCFCTDTAPLHTCASCQLAVRKKPFRHPAHSHAKHSSHFWKPLGTDPHPCCELRAGSRCVWESQRGPQGATYSILSPSNS